MNDTPTPRTDAAELDGREFYRGSSGPSGYCDADFARDLERQLAEATAWRPIETAPKDGTEIVVYCPPAHGINHMASVCAWHEDAGFCVDELREPTHWQPLPNPPTV